MIHRKIADARSDGELDQILIELRDCYGPVPETLEHLEHIMADRLGIQSIDREAQNVVIKFRPDSQAETSESLETRLRVVTGRGDTTLMPPATIKLDLRAGQTTGMKVGTTTGVRPGRCFDRVRNSRDQGQGTAKQWRQLVDGPRGMAGEVKAGFTKEEILKPPKEDPSAPGGVLPRYGRFIWPNWPEYNRH